MSAGFGALVLALVGVLGTLSASIVTQVLSARNQARAFESQVRREQELGEQSIKRSCYIAMFANSRRYRIELMNYLYAVQAKAVNDAVRADLEEARRAYSTSVAETELTAGAEVLAAVKKIDRVLSPSFAQIKMLEREDQQPGKSFEEILTTLGTFWDLWPIMQHAMRRELHATHDSQNSLVVPANLSDLEPGENS